METASQISARGTSVDSTDAAHFTVDTVGHIVAADAGCTQQCGYSVDELLQMTWLDLCAPEALAATVQAFFRQDGNEHQVTSVLVCKSGQRKDVEITGRLTSVNGRPAIQCVSRDVSHRRSVAELRQSLQQHQLFVDRITQVSTSVIYVIDLLERRLVYLNSHQSAASLGYTAQQIIAMGDRALAELLHPDDLPRILQHLAQFQSLSEREVVLNDYRMRHRDGSWHWFSAREAVHLRDSHGMPRQIIGAAVDVTTQKQAQDVLKVSEERFRRLSESGIVGIAFFRRDGSFTDANDGFLRMIRHSRADLEQGRIRWDTLTPPEWLPRTLLAVSELDTTGRITPYEKEYFRSDGTRFWGLFGGALIEGQSGGVAFILDITERKEAEAERLESERQLRAFFESAAVGCAQVDCRTGAFLLVNDRLCQITGYSREELLTRTFTDITYPEDREKDLASYRRLIADEITEFRTEKRYLHRDGHIVWVQVDATAIREASGNIYRTMGVVQDITARREAQESIRRAKEAAEAASSAKDHFLAVLSHELRTPLTPVLAAAQMLASDQTLSPAHADTVRMIERNVALEARLIDDLLDLTRITRGKLQMRKEPVDVHEKISQVVRMLSREIEDRNIRLLLDFAAQVYSVEGDPARIQQMIWNLLTNAVKFTPVGGTVGVQTAVHHGRIHVTVTDTGIGIDPATLPRVFDAFEQGGEQTTRRFGGLGLGLTITRALVEMHGGEISVASEGADQGAQFRLELPLLLAAPHDQASAAGPRTLLESARRLKILLVEDHADTRRMMMRLLSGSGAQVTTAGSVGEAIRTLSTVTDPFDMLICDIGLPDGSGLDIASFSKKRWPDTWCLALSGYGMEKDIQRSFDAGFDEHLTKPVDLKLLHETIARLRRP